MIRRADLPLSLTLVSLAAAGLLSAAPSESGRPSTASSLQTWRTR